MVETRLKLLPQLVTDEHDINMTEIQALEYQYSRLGKAMN